MSNSAFAVSVAESSGYNIRYSGRSDDLGFEVATVGKVSRSLLAFEPCLAVTASPLCSERVSRLVSTFQLRVKRLSISKCKEILLIISLPS